MEKVNIGTTAFVYPMPMTLVGSNVGGQPNFMAVAWVNRCNHKPPLLVCGLNKRHYTPEGIRENETFSVNIPTVEMLEETDYCGLVSGRKTDKSKLFEVFYGELKTAPMIKQCPLNIECKLFDIHELPTNNLYIGEIVAAYTEEKYLTDDGKHPDIKKINPFVLTMPDNSFWNVGEYLGKAWDIGKKLKKE
ncbi:MAG: flavin reductase family protein [Promethearchaeota archaeon]